MNNLQIQDHFSQLSTPLVFDACIKLGVTYGLITDLKPLIFGIKLAGRVLPVRHYGSVDIFLEAIESASVGDVLVIDNQARKDEACIGDLITLEAKFAQLAGMVVWGYHRDTAELLEISLPVLSLGACPAGPTRLDLRKEEALLSAYLGPHRVTRDQIVLADDDGILLVQDSDIEQLLSTAQEIAQTERRQAEKVKQGQSLREQLQFKSYLQQSAIDPAYTFRKHLVAIKGEIEV